LHEEAEYNLQKHGGAYMPDYGSDRMNFGSLDQPHFGGASWRPPRIWNIIVNDYNIGYYRDALYLR
jgi:hypothetical protein